MASNPPSGAGAADGLLVPVSTGEEVVIFAVEAERVTIVEVPSLDMTRPVCDVTFDGVEGRLVADRGRALMDRALALGAAMLAAESSGVAAHSLEATVAYLKERQQFGRIVGGYQALKHRLADLYVEVETALSTARYAACLWAADAGDTEIGTAVAASYCSEVAVRVTEEAIQLHGGIGMTWEHPAHLYLKRAKANQLALGGPDRHRAALGRLVKLTALDRE